MHNVPTNLLHLQKWFASIITRPIDENNKMIPISPSGKPMSMEAALYISPNSKLKSEQRIEIYNQQYFWRLFNVLHDHYPSLIRLFGYSNFNVAIARPFLKKPSMHWSLGHLGKSLPEWIEESYQDPDKELILGMAQLDQAYHETFIAQTPCMNLLEINKKVLFQPHLHLFRFGYNMISFREELVAQEVEYWIDHPFPKLEKRECFFVLYRQNKLIKSREISRGEWTLLDNIKKGLTIEQACDKLEQEGGSAFNEASQFIQTWIQRWIQDQFLQKEASL